MNVDLNAPLNSEEGVLNDFHDGLASKSNTFFQENPSALKLIFFQDGFELVCPIGQAKLKHKLLGIYLSLGNLPDYHRTHVNSIQLVGLCKEKEFNHQKVFGPIVDDLLDLETNGINIPGKGVVKAGLAFVCGDNLGSHALGGYLENFSRAIFFCRYCIIDRGSFTSAGGHLMSFPSRTIENYNTALQGITLLQRMGIKLNSEFNRLLYYHVAMYGLPPCLGHDVLEGIGSHDLALAIHYFVRKQWFTYNQLNDAIKSFPYSQEDRRDKPIEFLESYNKVCGGAWQVCNFIKLFPIMIENFIQDRNDPVWLALLLLVEIVEILCSPSIHKSFLGHLHSLILQYVDARAVNFPHDALRPKHHYLTHYCELILAFGPLIKAWTLRFESKHSFFCRCAQSSRNYKNILHTVATKHEMFQCYLRCGSDMRCLHDFVNIQECSPTLYCQSIQTALQNANLTKDIRECTTAIIKGTKYCKGTILALSQTCYQVGVVFGRIAVILVTKEDEVFFLLELLISEFQPQIRAYCVKEKNEYQCTRHSDLISYYPLSSYYYNGKCVVKLKHGLVAKELNMKAA